MKLKVEVSLKVTDAETGADFFETKQTWASMSLKSAVDVERALYDAQGRLLAQSEAEVLA